MKLSKELVDYLLEEVSSTEFDLIVYSALHADWDGCLQVSARQIAAAIGSKEKYVKHTLKKLSSKFRRRVFLAEKELTGKVTYRLNIGKSSSLGFNEKTDLYCKNYSFFHTDEFRKLSIHSKRVILAAAYKMSTTTSEEVELSYNTFVPNKTTLANRKFTRGRLLHAIEEINSSFSVFLSVALKKHNLIESEILTFNFAPGTLNLFEINDGELLGLQKQVALAGFYKPLNSEFCKEILRTGKYIFNSFRSFAISVAKERNSIAAIDEFLKLARFVYTQGIKRLSQALYKNLHLLDEPKEASAYFSSILQEIVATELIQLQNRAKNIQLLIEQVTEKSNTVVYENASLLEFNLKLEHTLYLAEVLEKWNLDWIDSRVKATIAQIDANAVPESELLIDSKNKLIALKESLLDKLASLIEYNGFFSSRKSDVFKHWKELFTLKIDASINRLGLY